MKIILAPQVRARLDGPRQLDAGDLSRYPSVQVEDGSPELLQHVVDRAIKSHARRLLLKSLAINAPPFRPGSWWLATVGDAGHGQVAINTFPPNFFYGIDSAGRVHFLHLDEIRVDDLSRALAEGHYGDADGTLVIIRAGEFGGNGAFVGDAVVWFLMQFPSVLLGLGASRLALRRDHAKREELKNLASAWSARNIESPSSLRQFVETRPVWAPEILGMRLEVSSAAALRLLVELGYQESGEGMLAFDGSTQAESSRDRWIEAERAHSDLVSLDELLAAPET